MIYLYHDNGKLSFEGENINGKCNGFGKAYYQNGKLKYMGEFLDGEYNGKGREYFQNGNIKSDGEFLKGNFVKDEKVKKRKKRKY